MMQINGNNSEIYMACTCITINIQVHEIEIIPVFTSKHAYYISRGLTRGVTLCSTLFSLSFCSVHLKRHFLESLVDTFKIGVSIFT